MSLASGECTLAVLVLLLTQLQLSLVKTIDTDYRITVTRLDDGDEFTNPSSCGSPCPINSSLKAQNSCMCKCLSEFTWRQDEGKCSKATDCDFTVLDGDYVATLAIQDSQDNLLKPEDHALRRNGQVLTTGHGIYHIQKMYLLGENLWKQGNDNDFYMARKGGSEQRVKSRTQSADVADYAGTLLNFTLTRQSQGSDQGCLLVKIAGALTYRSQDFPLVITSNETILPTFHSTIGYTDAMASHNQSTNISSTVSSSQGPVSAVVISLTPNVFATNHYGLSDQPPSQTYQAMQVSPTPIFNTPLAFDLSPGVPTATILSTLSTAFSYPTATDNGFVVSMSRLDDGDEFTRPTPCSGPCPANSLPKQNEMCTCKCQPHFTWRQDLDTCILSSDCAYTVLDGSYIPTLTIQRAMDQILLPQDHVLRFNGNIIHDRNVYEIKTFYILKDGQHNFWKEADRSHDFYIVQKNNSEHKIKSQTDPKFIGDYSGVLFNFTLSLVGSEVGCLMVKITGSHQYAHSSQSSTEVPKSTGTVPVSPTLSNVVIEAARAQQSSDDKGAIVGGTMGGIVILLIVMVVLIIIYKKRSNKDKTAEMPANQVLQLAVCNPSYDAVDMNKPSDYEKVKLQFNSESNAVYEDPSNVNAWACPPSVQGDKDNEQYEELHERPNLAAEATYESCKPVYGSTGHGHSQSISVDMNKQVGHGDDTIPFNPIPDNSEDYETPVTINTTDGNDLCELPEPMGTQKSDRLDHNRPLPATPNGTSSTYKSLLDQTAETSPGGYTSHFGHGNSLYEEITSAVSGTE